MTNKVHVSYDFNSINKYGEELCGDKVKVRHNEEYFIMVLADGLGSGVKANILSTLTSTIISEMMIDGATIEEVVDTLEKTLPECKERHIAYSTFTILQVFYSGYARLVEFDNPEAIILRDYQELKAKSTVHQFQGKRIKETLFDVKPNDFIVFFSDGIIHAGLGEILNLGWDHDDVVNHLVNHYRISDTPKQMNDLLLYCVSDLYGGKCKDDSTVGVCKIIEAKTTIVMVGPPQNMDDDYKVVSKLMAATGKKVCCGGTTSNIVARYLKQDIIVDTLESITNDVPPIGYIKGIDLVTEGVLTLSKTNEHLKEAIKSKEYYENLIESKQKDGASLLAQLLIKDSSEIIFLVGSSDNPAHSQFAYSTISLSAKLRLIEKIKINLIKLGKIVVIEHY